MKTKKIVVLTTLFLLVFCSCVKKPTKIVVNDIDDCCNTSLFRGIKPDIYFSDLCDIAGEPNEFIDMNRGGDEKCHNPIYYFNEGKVMCFWSGDSRDEIGVVEFTPYDNIHIPIDSFFTCPLDNYGITSETTKISIYQNKTLYYAIRLKNHEIICVTYIKDDK